MLEYLIVIASGLVSTTYGFGEYMCGDIGSPAPCVEGAVTASGVTFDPEAPQAAIAAPTSYKLKPTHIYLKVDGGKCKKIALVDKMNPRYIGRRGFDLTPKAVQLLTGKPAVSTWSGIVHVCGVREWREAFYGAYPTHILDLSVEIANND